MSRENTKSRRRARNTFTHKLSVNDRRLHSNTSSRYGGPRSTDSFYLAVLADSTRRLRMREQIGASENDECVTTLYTYNILHM